jgi:hypothetical protein
MRSGRRRLFIYYRLAECDVAPACAAVRRAQHTLCTRHPGLAAELLQRPEPSADGQRTLMETYVVDAQAEPGGVDAGLQAEIETLLCAALQPWGGVTRHIEVFVY